MKAQNGMMGNELAANGMAKTVKKIFSRQTSVEIDIDAQPARVWALLSDLEGWTKWTSTIVELRGKLAIGERIQLRSSLAPERLFNLKIKVLEQSKKLVWGDVLGSREYTLTSNSRGGTRFSMVEIIGGPIFPLFAKMIPPFDDSFTQFALDLKKAIEGN
jgi:uncharacterized protein YndB with AHSA1/START domain